MKRSFPSWSWRMLPSGALEWNGALQPTPDSPTYSLRLLHRPDRWPRVWVVSPAIRTGAPHRYGDGSLCLFWPREWEWRATEPIAATIVPWAAFWLYYYELWLVTGEWLGTSSHATPNETKEAA